MARFNAGLSSIRFEEQICFWIFFSWDNDSVISAFLIGINAYNQPGVESGKKLADNIIELLLNIQQHLKSYPEKQFTASELSEALGVKEKTVTVFRLLLRLAINGRVKKIPHNNNFLSAFKQIDS